MTAITGRTGNLVGFSTGRGTTPWDTEMEAALRKMDAMLASTVVAITNTLPGSANEGDLYLVGTSPTGVAAGWANRIARWRGSPAGWEAYQPMQGWIITIVGESTNKVRRYNGTAWVALAADAGAEPYAGVPAATSFWRSTAAGVRAWVQLVASDITDLATTLAAYLTKNNPTYTGTLTGQSARFYDLAGHGDGVTICDSFGNVSRQTIKAFRDATLQVIPWSAAGIANGVAELDSTGRVPSGQLPSYVDDVVEVANFAALPGTGEVGKIYITLDDNKTWRWSGTAYAEISASLALGETSATAYRGDRGKIAYDHSQLVTGNPHGTTAADVGAAKEPSKLDVSASTTIGSIDATAIKVTTTDVNLTLSGGVNGQGWDIVCPTTSFGISIPTGVTLYAYAGSDIGPTTRAVGGGRGIRIVRIDAATWIAPNLTW